MNKISKIIVTVVALSSVSTVALGVYFGRKIFPEHKDVKHPFADSIQVVTARMVNEINQRHNRQRGFTLSRRKIEGTIYIENMPWNNTNYKATAIISKSWRNWFNTATHSRCMVGPVGGHPEEGYLISVDVTFGGQPALRPGRLGLLGCYSPKVGIQSLRLD